MTEHTVRCFIATTYLVRAVVFAYTARCRCTRLCDWPHTGVQQFLRVGDPPVRLAPRRPQSPGRQADADFDPAAYTPREGHGPGTAVILVAPELRGFRSVAPVPHGVLRPRHIRAHSRDERWLVRTSHGWLQPLLQVLADAAYVASHVRFARSLRTFASHARDEVADTSPLARTIGTPACRTDAQAKQRIRGTKCAVSHLARLGVWRPACLA